MVDGDDGVGGRRPAGRRTETTGDVGEAGRRGRRGRGGLQRHQGRRATAASSSRSRSNRGREGRGEIFSGGVGVWARVSSLVGGYGGEVAGRPAGPGGWPSWATAQRGGLLLCFSLVTVFYFRIFFYLFILLFLFSFTYVIFYSFTKSETHS